MHSKGESPISIDRDAGFGLWSEVRAAEATAGERGLSAQPTPARKRAGKVPLSSPAPGNFHRAGSCRSDGGT